METFDYSQVPYGFGLCASADCPKASTCLRHIALEHAPVKYPFLPTLIPQKLQAMKGKCEYYRPNKTVRIHAVTEFPDSQCLRYFQVPAYFTLRTQELLSCP